MNDGEKIRSKQLGEMGEALAEIADGAQIPYHPLLSEKDRRHDLMKRFDTTFDEAKAPTTKSLSRYDGLAYAALDSITRSKAGPAAFEKQMITLSGSIKKQYINTSQKCHHMSIIRLPKLRDLVHYNGLFAFIWHPRGMKNTE